jgi:hypothetical protein
MKYILSILVGLSVLATRLINKRKKKTRSILLPGPSLLALSSFLTSRELSSLESSDVFLAEARNDPHFLDACWRETLRSSLTCSLPASNEKPSRSKCILLTLERLVKFEPKTFILGAIAAHFELKPPFHFFEKPAPRIPGVRIVSFHSVVAAGEPGRVDWLSLNFVVSEINLEIFICTGNDAQDESRTMIITTPMQLQTTESECLISGELHRVVEDLRTRKIRPIGEIFVNRTSVLSEIDGQELRKLNRRVREASFIQLVDHARVCVDPPQGAGLHTHRKVLEELKRTLK